MPTNLKRYQVSVPTHLMPALLRECSRRKKPVGALLLDLFEREYSEKGVPIFGRTRSGSQFERETIPTFGEASRLQPVPASARRASAA